MADASQVMLVPGLAPSVVPAGRQSIFLDSQGKLCVAESPAKVRNIEDIYRRMPGNIVFQTGLQPSSSYESPDVARKSISTPTYAWGLMDDLSEFFQETSIQMGLSVATSWDSTGIDYTVAANRAGKNFYVYAVTYPSGFPYVLSANSTSPTGAVGGKYEKIGGFHCLCADVGGISGHPLSGYVAGDILPASIWDLKHRHPVANEGRFYDPGTHRWIMIYPPSISSGKLVSVFGGRVITGTTSPAMDWYDFCEALAAVGDRPALQYEFMSASAGSNQGTNVAGSVNPFTAGGHVDTEGRRMISGLGMEDGCGAWWQWGLETGAVAGTVTWKDQFAAARTTQRGQGCQEPTRAILGGGWDNGAYCGSRCAPWNSGPLLLYPSIGARGVAEPLAIGS